MLITRATGAGAANPRPHYSRNYAELLALIRDAGIDRAQLCAILGLDPETLPAGDDNPRPEPRSSIQPLTGQ